MTATVWVGVMLALAAGLLSGNCMLPAKFARHWRWENTWLVFSIVSLVILPWSLAALSVMNLASVYSSLPDSAFVAPLFFGVGWGVAQVLFGQSIARLGLALGYAIIVGLGALLGTLIPLLVQHRSTAATPRGALIFAGMFVMLAGIAVSAWSGRLRERSIARATRASGYSSAIAVAIVCGLLAPMLNYAFAFGQPIAASAVRLGNAREVAGYAVWPVALLGGLLPNLVWSMYLLTRNGTWGAFRAPWAREAWLASLMGLFWMGAFALYGVSAVFLGTLGTSVGWALFQIFMIMTATLSGVVTGEWRTAPRLAKQGLWSGLALLAIATTVIASGNT
jgi:L-rhamnose-proton symport protein RhaT